MQLTSPYIYKWDEFTGKKFEGAKRRARTKVKGMIPKGWAYSIKSSEYYDYTKGSRGGNSFTTRVLLWQIQFGFWGVDKPTVTLCWSPCSESQSVDRYWCEIKGMSVPGKPEISVAAPLILSEIEEVKKCVEVIMKEMHP